VAPDERAQREGKADLIAAGWKLGGIDAMALSSSDWNLGYDFVTGLVAKHDLPVLAANLTCDGKAFPGGKVVTANGLRVGIVGVTEGNPGDRCQVLDPVESARKALSELGPVDLTVALLPITGKSATEWDQADLPVDLVVDASGRHLDKPDQNGVGYVLSAGSRGKHLGFARLEVVPGAKAWGPADEAAALQEEVTRLEQRIEGQKQRIERATDETARGKLQRQLGAYEEQLKQAQARVAAASTDTSARNEFAVRIDELGAEVVDHAATKALVDAFKSGQEQVGGDVAAIAAVVRVAPTGSPFAGSETCKGCHADQAKQWESTGHARAWSSLVAQQRAMDQECFSCHVTGHGQQGGPADPATVAGLRDVQCESCHGAASAHVADPTKDLVKSPAQDVCVTCHDGKKDEGRFSYSEYLPKVTH
jgi:predicted CXXCH cytochrome family protein